MDNTQQTFRALPLDCNKTLLLTKKKVFHNTLVADGQPTYRLADSTQASETSQISFSRPRGGAPRTTKKKRTPHSATLPIDRTTAVTLKSSGLVGVTCLVTRPVAYFLFFSFPRGVYVLRSCPAATYETVAGTRNERLLCSVFSLFTLRHPRDLKSTIAPKGGTLYVMHVWKPNGSNSW